jgi:hypothetical protein
MIPNDVYVVLDLESNIGNGIHLQRLTKSLPQSLISDAAHVEIDG